MAKTTPWHSTKPFGALVYHDESECWDGNNIEPRYLAVGTAGRRLCATCVQIASDREARIRALLARQLRRP